MRMTNSSPLFPGRAGGCRHQSLEGYRREERQSPRRAEAGLQLLPGLAARNGVDIDKVILRVEGGSQRWSRRWKASEGLMAGDNRSLTLPKQGVPADRLCLLQHGTNTVD